jgi:hypothetical protein
LGATNTAWTSTPSKLEGGLTYVRNFNGVLEGITGTGMPVLGVFLCVINMYKRNSSYCGSTMLKVRVSSLPVTYNIPRHLPTELLISTANSPDSPYSNDILIIRKSAAQG